MKFIEEHRIISSTVINENQPQTGLNIQLEKGYKFSKKKNTKKHLNKETHLNNFVPQQLVFKKQPRPYQAEIIESVCASLQSVSRGQLIMPCGTGKTLTSLWIHEKLQLKRTLVLFPSLALLRQTKNEWNKNRLQAVPYICVCSEKDIDRNSDCISVSPNEVDGNVTSSPETLRRFLESDGQSIVFCTYQSMPVLVEGLKGTSLSFDIIFCDEAHKTAGLGKSYFRMVHDNAVIPAARRLYMTATPRIYKENHIGNIQEGPRIISDMSNCEVFGEVLYQLNLRTAIDLGILVDYKVVVVGVLEEEIADFIKNGRVVSEGISMEDIAHNYAVQKFMQEWGARNVVSFHSSIKRAQNFATRHEKLFPDVGSFHVNGRQPTSVREGHLREFGESSNSIVSNARCLTEGVDIPAIDGVFFCDPKNSHIGIMQGLGRALRRADHRSKKTGYIVIPTLHSRDSNVEDEISKGRYAALINVIYAINSYDDTFIERLQNQIREARLEENQGHGLGMYQEKVIEVLSANIDFSQYLYTQCLRSLFKVRMPYLEFKQWLKDNGINTQRKYRAAYRAGLLPNNFPSEPVYSYFECKSWCDLFDKEPRKIEKRISYGKLKQWLKKHGINSKRKYFSAFRERRLPLGSPCNPMQVYRECKGWWHLFGKDPGKSRITMPYFKLQEWLKKHGINTQRKYRAAYRAGLLPLEAPCKPEEVYSEWQSWWHFFGKVPLSTLRMPYLAFKNWLKDQGINSQSKYYAAFKSGILPPHSPFDPIKAYHECKGWTELFDKKPRKKQ